ncbi:MAG TPA: protein kinase [Polyangiaceae bacterium]|jgi:eukaryotic-like serine/threonine-protein kinase|nr:protein kinase [Polyangiaceae bacterium]
MSFTPGTSLGDKLRLERLVGRGASGEVWAAEHLRLGARVAVKILDTMLEDRADMQQRFMHEARAVAQIGSPHVVSVHDCDITPEGHPYIVMELLQGESLDERLKRLGPLPLHEVLDAVEQTCRALAAAHARGIIHRDVKPANVFLVAWQAGLVFKLIDFGIAKHPAIAQLGLTATGVLLGTPRYMSPEQLEDPRQIDHRADLWSTAVVAYECLTGKLPFPVESLVALCLAQRAGEYTPPRRHRPDLPASLDRWFARAFAPDINRRFQHAMELAATLREAAPAQRMDPVVSERRNFAIGPTAPQPMVSGTVVVPAFATTVAIDAIPEPAAESRAPQSLSGTVALPDAAPMSMDLGSTVHDPSLIGPPSIVAPPSVVAPRSVVAPPSMVVAPIRQPPFVQAPPPSRTYAAQASQRASIATIIMIATLALGVVIVALAWWLSR